MWETLEILTYKDRTEVIDSTKIIWALNDCSRHSGDKKKDDPPALWIHGLTEKR